MKHLKLLLAMVVAANMMFVTSCKKDEDEDPTTPKPTLAVAELSNSGTAFTVLTGTELIFAWDAIGHHASQVG